MFWEEDLYRNHLNGGHKEEQTNEIEQKGENL